MSQLISAQIVINGVNRALRSYYETGLVDPIGFPEQIRKALQDIGLTGGSSQQIRIPVINGKCRVPQGFISVEELYWEPVQSSQQPVPLYELGLAPGGCVDTYRLQGDWFWLNRPEGILILYYQGSSSDHLPQIPDEPLILEYLQKKLIYEQLYDWFLNGDVADLQQRLGEAKLQADTAYRNALYFEKLPSFEQLYRYKRTRPRLPL